MYSWLLLYQCLLRVSLKPERGREGGVFASQLSNCTVRRTFDPSKPSHKVRRPSHECVHCLLLSCFLNVSHAFHTLLLNCPLYFVLGFPICLSDIYHLGHCFTFYIFFQAPVFHFASQICLSCIYDLDPSNPFLFLGIYILLDCCSFLDTLLDPELYKLHIWMINFLVLF